MCNIALYYIIYIKNWSKNKWSFYLDSFHNSFMLHSFKVESSKIPSKYCIPHVHLTLFSVDYKVIFIKFRHYIWNYFIYRYKNISIRSSFKTLSAVNWLSCINQIFLTRNISWNIKWCHQWDTVVLTIWETFESQEKNKCEFCF